MNRKTLSTLVSTLLIVSGTSPIFAASNTPQISSSQSVTVTQPKIKLDAKTINAINNPKLPSAARIPEKKIKPKHSPVINQLQPDRPYNPGKPSGTAHQPRVEAPTLVTIEKPQLETTFQSSRIKNIQEAIATTAVLKQIDPDMRNAGRLPGQTREDPAAGTRLEGHGGIGREERDFNELVNDLMGLGGDGFNSDSYLGQPDDRPGGLDSGVGSAAGRAGAPTAPTSASITGLTSYQTGRGADGSSHFKGTYSHRDGSSSGITSELTPNEHGGNTSTSTVVTTDSSGNTVYTQTQTEVKDKEGNVISSTTSSSGQFPSDGEEAEEAVADAIEQGGVGGEQGGQDAPTDNATDPDANPCHAISNFGCVTKQTDHMDKVTQPARGDAVTSMGSSSPTAALGATVVTNPDEFHQTGGSGGSGNTKPYDPRDPEEGLDPHGPGPVPGGPSTVATAEALDEAMGVAALD